MTTITVEEIREMKRLPKGKISVTAKDRAMVSITGIAYDVTKKGKTKYLYEGEVQFKYENGKFYTTLFREKSLKETIKKTMEYFDQRNKQMKGYEERQNGNAVQN